MGQSLWTRGAVAALGGLLLGAVVSFAVDPLFEVPLSSCSYGGPAVADLDGNGDLEVLFGTYYNDERVIALDHDGGIHWALPSGGGPVDNSVTVADLDLDGVPEVMWGNSATTVFHVADPGGVDHWSVTVGEVLDAPEAIGDVNGDGLPDILTAVDGPRVVAYSGVTGAVLFSQVLPTAPDHDFQPAVWDLDGDGLNEVFTVYGRGRSDTPSLNWGTAVALPLGVGGPGWPTFSHDHHHSGNFHYPPGAGVNEWLFADGFESGGPYSWSLVVP